MKDKHINIEKEKILKHFLDDDGRVKIWPAKRKRRLLVLNYLSEKFDSGVEYTEKEVNLILGDHHTFNDHVLLRRELFDNGFLGRELNGSKYWRRNEEGNE